MTKTKAKLISASVLILTSLFVVVNAGELEPAAPPAPTMVTLQEIYDLIQSQGGGSPAVPTTGQSGCWDGSGAPISCMGTGQDGEYRYGDSVSPRFTDNGDGTVKDNLTGLIWLQNVNCFGARSWTNALTDANTLSDGACSLTDGSVVGDWRLPNLRELHSLIDFQNWSPALPTGHPFSGNFDPHYWSSTTRVYEPFNALYVNLGNGVVTILPKTNTEGVWPVRGGL